MRSQLNHLAVAVILLVVLSFILGILIGWFVWEDNNVTPLTKPDCELRKGYYTVVSFDKTGYVSCGLTKKLYHTLVKPQETQE